MKFFEICAEVLVPKFTRAEVRLPAFRCINLILLNTISRAGEPSESLQA